ncbi:MAG: hypothetical protein V4598_02690 [Bdellovibrionota bacterium]
MKFAFLLLILSVQVFASVDEIPSRSSGEKLPRKAFDRVIKIFETTFSPYAEANGRELEFMTDYDEDWIQAFARRWETDQVIVYGGIAAIKNGSEDTMALILCHETGHLYGGNPVSDEFNKLSLEGQADYWAAGLCLDKILPQLSPRMGQSIRERKIDAFLAVTAQFAENRNLPHPRLETPDQTVVETTNQTHPNPQCRLDTMMAGMNGNPRPACWYKK